MAIKRCPYCRSIIDEEDRYCNNCGTQLIFLEEEYSGEDLTEEEPFEEVLRTEGEKEAGDSLEMEKSVVLVPRIPRRRAKKALDWEEEDKKPKTIEIEEEKSLEELGVVKPRQKPHPPAKEEFSSKRESEPAKPELKDEIDEKIRELAKLASVSDEEIGGEKPAELQRKKRKKGKKAEPESKALFSEEEKEQEIIKTEDEFKEELLEKREHAREAEESEIGDVKAGTKEEVLEAEEEIPAWAKKIQETPLSPTQKFEGTPAETETEEEKTEEPVEMEEHLEFAEEEAEKEEIQPDEVAFEVETPAEEIEEELLFSQSPTSESGIGIPEQVLQKSLPFEEGTDERSDTEEESVAIESLFNLKAKIFDLLFITALWFITLAIASRLLGVSLVQLLSLSTWPLILFYLILLGTYFFLFVYFLGETLGDRFFSRHS